jgi:uncharacterized repeat protein (TIGR01451 family)
VPGSSGTYTIDVVNPGPSTARAVSLLDSLPAGIVVEQVNPLVGTCAPVVTDQLTCQLGDIPPSGSARVVVFYTVDPAVTDPQLVNSALATSDTAAADQRDPPAAVAALVIGPTAIPPDCTASGQTVTCPLGTMAAGGIQALQFTGQVAAGTAPGTALVGTATVSANGSDVATANNTDADTIMVMAAQPAPADDNDPGIRGPEDRGSGHRSQKPRITLDHGRPRARPAGHRSGARRVGWGPAGRGSGASAPVARSGFSREPRSSPVTVRRLPEWITRGRFTESKASTNGRYCATARPRASGPRR